MGVFVGKEVEPTQLHVQPQKEKVGQDHKTEF